MTYQVRWMIRRDMPEVMEIDQLSFDFPWDDDQFIRTLRQQHIIGMVIEDEISVIGFMVYKIGRSRIRLCRLAVAPYFRRSGAGAALLAKLKSKLSTQRPYISLLVRETNLAAQLFYRSQGFNAVKVDRGHYGDTGEDAYEFEYRLPVESPVAH